MQIIVVVQSLNHVQLFATPWTAACQASLCITISHSWLKLMSTESMMPSNHLILCRPLLLPPSIFPSIRVFSNESVLCTMWPKYWHFGITISPSNEYSGFSFRIDWFDLLGAKGLSRVFSNTTVWKHQFFGTQPSLQSTLNSMGFPPSSVGKESACNTGDLGSIPGLGRSPGEENDNPFQYSWLENPHGQRCLMGYIPWGHKDLDPTEQLSKHTDFCQQSDVSAF